MSSRCPEGLTRLIDDPELRQRMGAKGQQTIAEGYFGEVSARNVLRILCSVVENCKLAVV